MAKGKFPKLPRVEIKPDSFLEVVASWLAIPLYVVEFFKRHDTMRTWIIRLAVLAGVTGWIFGPSGIAFVFSLSLLALNLLYAVVFMVIQFGALMWFMSRTRLTEIHPGDPKTITFDDYWGQEHIVALVRHWNKLLSKRKQFESMGGKALNGILLIGPPGTGKTMLAKAMAGDEGVAFLGTEGSSFRAMFWGVDTMKMMAFVGKARKLARRYGACIAYIDEIDSIGMSRGGTSDGQTQTAMSGGGMFGMMSGALTRLLYEMDGIDVLNEFDTAHNRARKLFGLSMLDLGKIMFMGATNMPHVLDKALTRAGRFDQPIVVGLPDEGSRRAVIEGYLKTIKTDGNIDVELLVQDTPGATPATLMTAITKVAVRNAIFDNRDAVAQHDIEMAIQERMIGIQNPIENWDIEQKKAVAAHEAGHTVVARIIRPHKKLVRASIVRRGHALGYMLDVNPKDIYAHPQADWKRDIIVSVAGDVAVEMIMGELWTGMTGDMMKVRELVGSLLSHGAFGTWTFALLGSSPGGAITPELDKQVSGFINDCRAIAQTILMQHGKELEALYEALVAKDDLTGTEILAIMEQAKSGKAQNVSEQLEPRAAA